jgi:hypothetical protein
VITCRLRGHDEPTVGLVVGLPFSCARLLKGLSILRNFSQFRPTPPNVTAVTRM